MKFVRTRRLLSLLATLACLIPLLAIDCVMGQFGPLPPALQPAPAPAESTGDQTAAPSGASSPLQVLDECVAAFARGDFASYADQLTAEEQTMQAGFVVAMLTMIQQVEALGGDGSDPEMILVTRAMDDLLRKHVTSAEAYEKTQVDSAEVQQQLFGQLMLASMMSSGDATSVNGAVPGMPGLMGGDVHGTSRAAAEVLKSPREFLIDVLAELTQPMTITRRGETETKTLIESADLMEHFQSAEWTLYRRGSYAVAVADFPMSNARDDADLHEDYTTENEAESTVVEFRMIEGQWKISRLLPTDMIRHGPVATVSASEPAAVAAPVAMPDAPPLVPVYNGGDLLPAIAPSTSYPNSPPVGSSLLPPAGQVPEFPVPTGTPIGLPEPPSLPR